MSSSDESEVEHNESMSQARGLDLDSAESRTIISDVVQYAITASQKKLPIKKASE